MKDSFNGDVQNVVQNCCWRVCGAQAIYLSTCIFPWSGHDSCCLLLVTFDIFRQIGRFSVVSRTSYAYVPAVSWKSLSYLCHRGQKIYIACTWRALRRLTKENIQFIRYDPSDYFFAGTSLGFERGRWRSCCEVPGTVESSPVIPGNYAITSSINITRGSSPRA